MFIKGGQKRQLTKFRYDTTLEYHVKRFRDGKNLPTGEKFPSAPDMNHL